MIFIASLILTAEKNLEGSEKDKKNLEGSEKASLIEDLTPKTRCLRPTIKTRTHQSAAKCGTKSSKQTLQV